MRVESNGGLRVAGTYLGNYPSGLSSDWTEELNGIANDGSNWYFAQNSLRFPGNGPAIRVPRLLKLPFGRSLTSPSFSKKADLPLELAILGYNHYGDLHFFQGFLFVPVESDGSSQPGIAVFDSELRFVALNHLEFQSKAGWVTINPVNRRLYSSNTHINMISGGLIEYVVDYSRLSRREPGPFLTPSNLFIPLFNRDGLFADLQIMQGGVFSPDGRLLYLSNGYPTGVGGDGGGLRAFDISTGRLKARSGNDYGFFNMEYHIGFPQYEEPEGLDWVNLDSAGLGQLHAILLNNGHFNFDSLYLKHYTLRVP